MTLDAAGEGLSEYGDALRELDACYAEYIGMIRKWLAGAGAEVDSKEKLIEDFSGFDSIFFENAQKLAEGLELAGRRVSQACGKTIEHPLLAKLAGEKELHGRVKSLIAEAGHLRVEALKAMEIILKETGEEISKIEASLRLKSRYNPLRETGNILNGVG